MFKLLKRFVSYYKPHKKMLILDLLAALMISITGMVYPILTNKVLDTYFPEENYKAIVIAGISILGIYVIRMLLNYFVQCYGHVIGVRMQSQMRKDLFAHLQKLPYKFYDNNETGKIMTRITSDLFDVTEFSHHCPEELFIAAIKALHCGGPFLILPL